MNAKQREDLEWTAFRYVAAELSPAESREFEGRLEHDQEAREAVGRLVEVTCAVRSLDWDSAPRVAPAGRWRPWYRHRGVQAIAGLALGLTVALVVWGPRGGKEPQVLKGGFAAIPPNPELAVVWSHARVELHARQDEDAALWRWLAPGERETEVASSTDEEAAADTPDWMVSAVAAMESKDEGQHGPAPSVEGI